MRGKRFTHVSEAQLPNLLEALYSYWKVMCLDDIAKEIGVETAALNRYVGIIRDRSEARYGEEGRFKVLPRKIRIEQPSYILIGVEDFLDKFEEGKLPAMKE